MTAQEDYPIEYFRMTGVHGYKDITMTMKGKTTVFVSENGAGKTTILNAIRLLLEQDFVSLMRIDFKSIFIKLLDHREIEIKNERSSLLPLDEITSFLNERFSLGDSFWSEHDITKFAKTLIDSKQNEYYGDALVNDLYNTVKFPKEYINHFLRELKENISNKMKSKEQNSFKMQFSKDNTFRLIAEALRNIDVVFLPTYRRVEKNFETASRDERETNSQRMFGRKRGMKLQRDGISYGLKDVEVALKGLTLDIERTSNLGYRSLSAKMLEDLIKYGNNDRIAKEQNALPSIEDLERFLNRVEDTGTSPRERRASETKKKSLIDSLKSLYNRDAIKDITYLNYFLTQLNSVIQETKEQESKIEKFVAVCDKYLSSAGDSKSLKFDPQSLEVIVKDSYTGERISLNDLSSGEKQVISLMATIYLNDNTPKIILIDEPELSLSIDWQRMILPDLNAGENVKQVIAITHSPFIFDNELDPYATAMKVHKGSL
ncbi:TPA: AAA family ATPase [Serratia marcescens]|uniref:ATP binding protein n=1 Tax=Serratia marcescens SM39 TaxID=1334564 RepID=A0AAT9E1U2_SERMA|nr:AAA family ATPase [Serratia marcescens]BAO34744.1 putative ATP binding protein [Serratia marcescens SM39]BCZ42089.1 ATP-binding protein [Serratia marcescens]HBI6266790.1 AAA family ATPase [Serratia marcescens]HBI6951046.1 AAA family ATPase [Serratia marcescens]HBI6958079.1 AAA family ATPase [Serratia marcescens]